MRPTPVYPFCPISLQAAPCLPHPPPLRAGESEGWSPPLAGPHPNPFCSPRLSRTVEVPAICSSSFSGKPPCYFRGAWREFNPLASPVRKERHYTVRGTTLRLWAGSKGPGGLRLTPGVLVNALMGPAVSHALMGPAVSRTELRGAGKQGSPVLPSDALHDAAQVPKSGREAVRPQTGHWAGLNEEAPPQVHSRSSHRGETIQECSVPESLGVPGHSCILDDLPG